MGDFPYADRFPVNRILPENGTSRDDVVAQLQMMSSEEDAFWESGKCSGTIYSGDHSHYDFLNRAFGLFSHANVLQRDMFPSATTFEGEIIAMTLDLFHAGAITGSAPAGLVTTGGTGSILHAILAYREHARQQRDVGSPNVIKPETAHPAFDKACRLLGIELRRAPVDPVTTQVDLGWVENHIDDQTVALIGSACNYGYGTIDPIEQLAQLAQQRGAGLHVDACLGGFILPFGEDLGYDIAPFDFRIPGVTSISADSHKYGYALKGTSTLLFRDQTLRDAQYFLLIDWSGGSYSSPGIEGSRSGGLLAATWAAMIHLGRDGYRQRAQASFTTAALMQDAVRSHPELRIIGHPSFLFSFTSEAFDIYHLNDFMSRRGWRLNGQQNPNALHMAVTGPQTQPGIAETFASDLADAVRYARKARGRPQSDAIYGSMAGALANNTDGYARTAMVEKLSRQQSLPTRTSS
jgi:sphinganine-1-phosphate aldolase